MNQLKFHFMEETKIIDIIICCDSMLPLVQILFHFVLGYGNDDNEFKTKENRFKARMKLNHSIFDK